MASESARTRQRVWRITCEFCGADLHVVGHRLFTERKAELDSCPICNTAGDEQVQGGVRIVEESASIDRDTVFGDCGDERGRPESVGSLLAVQVDDLDEKAVLAVDCEKHGWSMETVVENYGSGSSGSVESSAATAQRFVRDPAALEALADKLHTAATRLREADRSGGAHSD